MKNSTFLVIFTAFAAAVGTYLYKRDMSAGPVGNGPVFETSRESALMKAKRENKPVVLIFSASRCPPCQSMKKKVYPSSAVAPFHNQFVWAYLDVDVPANNQAGQQAGVQGIPHVQVLSADGSRELHKQVGGADPEACASGLASALAAAAR